MASSNEGFAVSSEEASILSIMHSVWKHRCIGIMLGLKIPDLICNSSEPSVSIEEIASRTGCETSLQLYPVMRLLAQSGIGVELENKHFTKNKSLELLRQDKGPSLGHLAEYLTSDEHFTALRRLPACVKYGKPAFLNEHGMTHLEYMFGVNKLAYDEKKMFEGIPGCNIGTDERRKEFAECFSNANAYNTYLTVLPDRPGVNNIYQVFHWTTCQTLVDMGGGSGYFMASILKLPDCDHIQGFVVDLPVMIDEAKVKFSELKVSSDRLKFIKQDFTKPFPIDLQLAADTVMFKNVINWYICKHDLMVNILDNCRNVFSSKGGRLLIIDYCSPDAGDTNHNIGINGFELGWQSIHWLSIAGYHILTKQEWINHLQEICKKTKGYRLHQIHDTFLGGKTIFELSYQP